MRSNTEPHVFCLDLSFLYAYKSVLAVTLLYLSGFPLNQSILFSIRKIKGKGKSSEKSEKIRELLGFLLFNFRKMNFSLMDDASSWV